MKSKKWTESSCVAKKTASLSEYKPPNMDKLWDVNKEKGKGINVKGASVQNNQMGWVKSWRFWYYREELKSEQWMVSILYSMKINFMWNDEFQVGGEDWEKFFLLGKILQKSLWTALLLLFSLTVGKPKYRKRRRTFKTKRIAQSPILQNVRHGIEIVPDMEAIHCFHISGNVKQPVAVHRRPF